MRYQQTQWSGGGGNLFLSIPVTMTIIGIWVLGFLTSVFNIPIFAVLFAFDPSRFPQAITGLFTYPLVMTADIFGLIFGGLILYWFGGSLERSWGTRNYILFLVGVSFSAAIFWLLGVFLFVRGLPMLADPWFMTSAAVVAWARLNPEQTILLWFVLPLKAKWIGWLTIAFLVIFYPMRITGGNPALGLFALGGVAFALGYVWYQKQWAWIPRRRRTKGKKGDSGTLRHPASSPLGALLRPFREWQRRRRVSHLQRTIRFDD